MSNFSEKMAKRVKQAREDAGYTQNSIAEELGITRDAYAWYETKRAMPPEHIPKFCHLTNTNERWLVSGKGRKEADYIEKLEQIVRDHLLNLEAALSRK